MLRENHKFIEFNEAFDLAGAKLAFFVAGLISLFSSLSSPSPSSASYLCPCHRGLCEIVLHTQPLVIVGSISASKTSSRDFSLQPAGRHLNDQSPHVVVSSVLFLPTKLHLYKRQTRAAVMHDCKRSIGTKGTTTHRVRANCFYWLQANEPLSGLVVLVRSLRRT